MNQQFAFTFTVLTIFALFWTCVFIYRTQIYGTAEFRTNIDEMSVESIFRAHNAEKTLWKNNRSESTDAASNKAQESAHTRIFGIFTTIIYQGRISTRKNMISKDGNNSFDGENMTRGGSKTDFRMIKKKKEYSNIKTVYSKSLENETESPNNTSTNTSEHVTIKTVYAMNKTETESTTIKIMVPPKLIDPYEFDYIINRPDTCKEKNLNMLIYVHSSPDYIKRRMALRTTWATRELLTKYKTAVLFFMGYSKNNITMHKIQAESEKYGDIIQENYLDSYHNLSLKGVSALKWIHLHCENVQMFVKIDDDVLVNVFEIFNSVNRNITAKAFTQNRLLCKKYFGKMPVIRDKKSRWYVSEDDFPRKYKFYPPYCGGMAFVMNNKAAHLLYNASIDARFFWVDDYFITGALVRRAGLELNDFPGRYLITTKNSLVNTTLFVHSPNTDKFYKYWDTIQRMHTGNVTKSVANGHTTIALVTKVI